jgi:hypothetical protein
MYFKHLNGPWPDFLARASISALCRTPLLLILFHLPVIGLPLVIAAFPVLHTLPGLGQSGPDVAYLSGYVVLKSSYAWLCTGSYFFTAVLGWHIARRILMRRREHFA